VPQRTEKDVWIEMSIREIWTQCHFAERAFSNLDPKAAANSDIVFSSIHSFLSHCAMVSKLLKAKEQSLRIGAVLNIPVSSKIHKREFRNHLEHYDERLKTWIRQKGVNRSIGTYNIGPKSSLGIPNIVFVSHYDPTTSTFTFVDEDLELRELHQEILQTKSIADSWVKEVESGIRKPPFA
jgi:hypothetical protein